MNNEIICRECHKPNAPGSKFCNHCGTRLPPGTSLICPNCQTPNPKNRFYCDHCGSRLVQDELPTEAESESEEPPDTTANIFSLPTRQPGDTGDLDSTAVPDWLKTGEMRALDQDEGEGDADELPEEVADKQKLPRLEELTPSKRTTDDLPDWLVDSEDEEPIVHAPTEITTEYFLDLMQEAEGTAGEEFLPTEEEVAGATAEAQLPGWLTEPAQPADAEPATAEPPAAETDLSDWLAELSQPTAADESLAEQPDTPAATAGDASDWMAELGPPDTDILAHPSDSGTDQPAESPITGAELPDWMAELGPPDTDILSQPTPDVPVAAEPPQPPRPLQPEEDRETALPDWLAGADAEETVAAVTPEPSYLDDAQPAGAGYEDSVSDVAGSPPFAEGAEMPFSDWLSEITPDEEAPSAEPAAFADALFGDAESAEAAPGDLTTDSIEPSPLEEEPEEALPDWLAGIAADEETIVATGDEAVDGALDGLFATGELADEMPLDWLSETGDLVEPAAAGVQEEPATGAAGDLLEEADQPLSEEPDWLTELRSLDTATLMAEDAAVEPDLADFAAAEPGAAPGDAAIVAEEALFVEETAEPPPEVTPAEEGVEDWASEESFQEEALAGAELPDWMGQLGPPVSSQPTDSVISDETLIPSEELPEWVASLRPTPGQSESSLPSPSELPPLPETLEDIPEELAGAELPDWLGAVPGAPGGETAVTPPEEASEIPDWLKSDSGFGAPAEAAAGTASPAVSSEWDTLLRDLPPAAPPQHELTAAEIPEWVQAIKPRELTEEGAEPAPVGPLQTSGPLAGMHSIIDVEPIIAMPRAVTPIVQFTVTREQQQQAALLRQLGREEKREAAAVVPRPSAAGLIWSRILLAAFLVAAILLGLLGPDWLPAESLSVPWGAPEVNAAVDAVAGQPVLVAFEYTPALAGELTPQAELLLAQLAANGSAIVTVSQYAAGTAVAAAQTEPYAAQNLGLVPGEAIGLRQLGDCLADGNNCDTLAGRPLDAGARHALAGVSLIIVLTGERDSLVNWVEQVGAANEIPLLAGVTQALGPVAAPYFASGQLQGVLAGFPATAAYEQAFGAGEVETRIRQQLNAQSMAQLLAAVLLLTGGLIYGIAGSVAERSNEQTRA